MSNYPNMSYCMCQNTVLAMQQIMNNMNMDGIEFLQDMGSDERRAFQELFNLCEAFMTQSQELQEEYDEAVRFCG